MNFVKVLCVVVSIVSSLNGFDYKRNNIPFLKTGNEKPLFALNNAEAFPPLSGATAVKHNHRVHLRMSPPTETRSPLQTICGDEQEKVIKYSTLARHLIHEKEAEEQAAADSAKIKKISQEFTAMDGKKKKQFFREHIQLQNAAASLARPHTTQASDTAPLLAAIVATTETVQAAASVEATPSPQIPYSPKFVLSKSESNLVDMVKQPDKQSLLKKSASVPALTTTSRPASPALSESSATSNDDFEHVENPDRLLGDDDYVEVLKRKTGI